jgi:hypothetical protein
MYKAIVEHPAWIEANSLANFLNAVGYIDYHEQPKSEWKLWLYKREASFDGFVFIGVLYWSPYSYEDFTYRNGKKINLTPIEVIQLLTDHTYISDVMNPSRI